MTVLSCPPPIEDPYFCPTKLQLWEQLLSLLPRGRAWQNHENAGDRLESPYNSQVGSFEIGNTPLGAEQSMETFSVMERYWLAFAELLEWFHQRACALPPEWNCETVAETLPEWQNDYGFPDECDPWFHLCDKVRAQGGATCAYLAEIAATRGWTLECSECVPKRESVAGCAKAGCARSCGCPTNVIWVYVNLPASSAYQAKPDRTARAGNARAGAVYTGPPCPPGAEELQCLIERWKPAHVKAIYIYQGDEQ